MSKPIKRAAPPLPRTTVEFLDAVKAKLSLHSDYVLAKKLQIPPSLISNYRSGHMLLKECDGIAIAKLLDLEPVYVLSCALAEKAARANRTDEKAVWEDLLKRLGTALAAPVVAFGLMSSPAPSHAEASYSQDPNTNYPNRRRRKMVAA